jgi:hypothetical protein
VQPDPGWRPTVARALFPFGRRRPFDDAILTMRQVFLSFVVSLFTFQFVLLFIPTGEPVKAGLAAVLVGVGAFIALVAPRFAPKLSCDSDAALAGTYRSRMFVYIAAAETPAPLGFVAYFNANTWWSYPLGALIALVSFWFAAPTAAHFARDQDALNAGGCGRSLVDALRGSHS